MSEVPQLADGAASDAGRWLDRAIRPSLLIPLTGRMFAAACAGALLVVSVGCIIAAVTGGSWIDAAAWIEALATVAAFGAAILAAVLVGRALELELEREGQRLKIDRSSQAALVAAWPANPNYETVFNAETGIDDSAKMVGVFVAVRNASEVPVTSVHVSAVITLTPEDPAAPSQIILGGVSRPYLPPSDSYDQWHIDLNENLPPAKISEFPTLSIEISFEFIDAAGVRWLRTRTGLEEVP